MKVTWDFAFRSELTTVPVLGDKVAHKKAFVKLCGCSSNNGNLVLLLIFREGIRLCLDRGLQDFIAFEFGS